LAEGVIEKLGQPGNMFSVITFGSQPCSEMWAWNKQDQTTSLFAYTKCRISDLDNSQMTLVQNRFSSSQKAKQLHITC